MCLFLHRRSSAWFSKGCGVLAYYSSSVEYSLIDSFFRFHRTLLLGVDFESNWRIFGVRFTQNADWQRFRWKFAFVDIPVASFWPLSADAPASEGWPF